MKKITLLLMVAASATIFQACEGVRTTSLTDTAGTDSNKTMVAHNDEGSPASGDANSSASADKTFANQAAISGLTEVELGKLAALKGTTSQIKQFGNMMVMDHGKANQELAVITTKKKFNVASGLDAEHIAKRDSLRRLSGKEFDQQYIKAMIEGHKKTLMLMKEQAANGKDAELTAFAAKTAPVVQHHLEEITKMQSEVK
jgi:putative membrane protein